jgi:glucose uptake protein GlcU
MSGLIASIDIFGQTITYPITTTVPGVVASLWSIFYFKEINVSFFEKPSLLKKSR